MNQVVPIDTIDFTAVKTKQQTAWSSGDYAVVGTTLQIVGEELCEALDLRAGEELTAIRWLGFAEQRLLAFTAGAVFHDDDGRLTAARRR